MRQVPFDGKIIVGLLAISHKQITDINTMFQDLTEPGLITVVQASQPVRPDVGLLQALAIDET